MSTSQHSEATQPLVGPSHTPFVECAKGPVGRSERRVDGVDKVTGAELYAADLFPGRVDLFAQAVRAGCAHGRLRKVNKDEALKLPGVIAVYTAEDMPGTNRQGVIRRDQPVLVEDLILFAGDTVALVVATTEAAARLGRDAVEVECEPLPVVATMDGAMADDAPKLHPDGNIMGGKRLRKGDVDTALAASDAIVSDTFVTQTVDHAFLDLEAGIARWDDSLLTIHVSGQWVHEEQRLTALSLGLPAEAVRVISPATGGAFGGREDLSIQVMLGMIALRHPSKTIAMRYSRAESMLARHKRHALRIHYTLGAMADGTLTAAKITVYSDEGAYASTGPAVLRKASSHATGPYRVPHVHADVYGVFTNNNPTGAMRGFGACQLAIAYEGMLDRMATRLAMDAAALRRMNLVRSGDAVTTGQRLGVATAVECMDAAMKQLETGPKSDRPLAAHERRGVGISVACFGMGYGDGFPDASRAVVRFTEDGRLELRTGGVDYGQGLITIMGQIAAEVLGLPLSSVDVLTADTHETPEGGSSSATRQTYFTGNAVKLAAAELREEMLDIAGSLASVHPNELDLADGRVVGKFDPTIGVPLADVIEAGRRRGYKLEAAGVFRPRTVCEDFDTGLSPRAFATYMFGCHISQVVVDIETGELRVERHIACHDVGKAINPQSVAGQIVGGTAQGIGMAIMEEVIMRDGRMMNASFTDYIIPTLRDVPDIETVILEHGDPGGPFGARGVGEPPLIASTPAVLSAIGNAIGTRPTQTPCTPQRVWEMLRGESPETPSALTPPHASMTK